MKDLYKTASRSHSTHDTPWRMTQSWHNLLFAHWPLAPAALAHLVPAPLEIDTYDGQAWLGVVAFRLDHIRLRGLPEVPFVRQFAEINVRTYVRLGDRRGVLFLSLDTDHLLTIGMARPWFHLPYQFARMAFAETYSGVYVASHRQGDMPAEFAADYWPVSEPFSAAPGSLEEWLTERYCYFAPAGEGIYRCDITHHPWCLQRAGANITRNTMLQAHGIAPPAGAPLLHYANYVKALIWPVQRVAQKKGVANGAATARSADCGKSCCLHHPRGCEWKRVAGLRAS